MVLRADTRRRSCQKQTTYSKSRLLTYKFYTMKNILYSLMGIAVLAIVSCKKLDNYAEPDATLTGRVVDIANKNALIQTEYGGGGTRIKLEELSWSDNPTPLYFNAMQDGTFNNTKLFAGTNR